MLSKNTLFSVFKNKKLEVHPNNHISITISFYIDWYLSFYHYTRYIRTFKAYFMRLLALHLLDSLWLYLMLLILASLFYLVFFFLIRETNHFIELYESIEWRMSYPFQKAKSDQKEDRSLGKKTNKKGNKQKLQKTFQYKTIQSQHKD